MVRDKEVWRAAVHGVTESDTTWRLNNIHLPKRETPQMVWVEKNQWPQAIQCHPRRECRHSYLRVLKSSWSSGLKAQVPFLSFFHLECLLIPEIALHPHGPELIQFWEINTPYDGLAISLEQRPVVWDSQLPLMASFSRTCRMSEDPGTEESQWKTMRTYESRNSSLCYP